MKTLSENRCHGGVQGVYAHASQVCGCDMTFGLFLPEEAERGPVPLIWYLSGLTCTHENAMVKAGALSFSTMAKNRASSCALLWKCRRSMNILVVTSQREVCLG